MTQKNYFVKQVSKKFFRKASRTRKHTSGFLYGFSGIQSLLKAEGLSSPKAISCKLEEMLLKTLSFFFLIAYCFNFLEMGGTLLFS